MLNKILKLIQNDPNIDETFKKGVKKVNANNEDSNK